MITLTTIISDIQTSNPTYSVRAMRAIEMELSESSLVTTPVIAIGYGPITAQHPEMNMAYDIYNTNAENVIQSIYLLIGCKVTDFDSVFKNIFKTLTGKNPVSAEAPHTTYTYVYGEPAGINNTTFWFLTTWKIGFPTNSLLQWS